MIDMKKYAFAVLGIMLFGALVWQLWPKSTGGFDVKTEIGNVTVSATKLPNLKSQQLGTTSDPLFNVFSRSRPQFAKDYNDWRSNVTADYAEDLGLTSTNFASVVANAEAPKDRVFVARLSATCKLGEYSYLISRFIGRDEKLGVSATVLKKENGEWKMHGRDDPKLLRVVPFQDFEALDRWIKEYGISFELE
jgi:hypothetical protein